MSVDLRKARRGEILSYVRAAVEPIASRAEPTPAQWQAIRAATDALLDDLAEWIRTGSDDDRRAKQFAADRLVMLWRAAAPTGRAGLQPVSRSTRRVEEVR